MKRCVVITLVIALFLFLTACSTQVEKESDTNALALLSDSLYQYKNTFIGDNSKVVAIIELMPVEGLTRDNVELLTTQQPYSIIVHYTTTDRTVIRPKIVEISRGFAKNAAVILSLVPNAENVHMIISDEYSEFTSGYYIRDNIYDHLITEQINAQMITNAAESKESFIAFLNLLDSIEVPAGNTSAVTEKVEEIIGKDYEIITNSGMGFILDYNDALTVEGFDIKTLASTNGVDIQKYAGKQIDFHMFNIENYKTNKGSSYVFAFYDEELIAYANLENRSNESVVKDSLVGLDLRMR